MHPNTCVAQAIRVVPPLQQAGPGHGILCHIPVEELAAVPHWLAQQDLIKERT